MKQTKMKTYTVKCEENENNNLYNVKQTAMELLLYAPCAKARI